MVAGNHNSIVSKRGTNKEFAENRYAYPTLFRRNNETPIYPFDIEVKNQNAGSNAGKVRVSLSNGNRRILATSTTKINDNTAHHICFNKTGSKLELWIDGTKEVTANLPTDVSGSVTLRGISNDYDILLGSKPYQADLIHYQTIIHLVVH